MTLRDASVLVVFMALPVAALSYVVSRLAHWWVDRSHPRLEWRDASPDALDVWSFRALERLAVHEARTEAEMGSRVERSARIVGVRRWASQRRTAA